MMVIVSILHLVFIGYLALLVYRKTPQLSIKQFFFPGLILKLFAGIAYGWIYWAYYGYGDTLNYFSDALLLADMAVSSPIDYLQGLFTNHFPSEIQHSLIFLYQPRALFLSKLASFFVIISLGNYWICSLYFSLFSFLGLFYLAQTCVEKWPQQYWQIAIAFLFFPSVLFWSSGLNKESIAMGCMGFIVAVFLNLYYKKRRMDWGILVASLLFVYVLWVLKYYYAAILLPILISLFVMSYTFPYTKRQWNAAIKLGVGATVFIGFLVMASYLHPVLTWTGFLEHLYEQHQAIVALSSNESFIVFEPLKPTLLNFIQHIPMALFSGLFRPGVWDAHSLFQWCAALENLLLLVLTMGAMGNIKKPFQQQNQLLLWASITYVLILAVLMAFAAPNFGALVRYKIAFLPFLVLIVLFDNPLLPKRWVN